MNDEARATASPEAKSEVCALMRGTIHARRPSGEKERAPYLKAVISTPPPTTINAAMKMREVMRSRLPRKR